MHLPIIAIRVIHKAEKRASGKICFAMTQSVATILVTCLIGTSAQLDLDYDFDYDNNQNLIIQ